MFKDRKSKDKKSLMYLLIITIMILVFFGWLSFLDNSFSHIKSNAGEIEEFDEISNSFKETVSEIKENVSEFKKIKDNIKEESSYAEGASENTKNEEYDDFGEEKKVEDLKNNFVEKVEDL